MKDRLNIVDEEGNIIGEETRENIHKKGLLHREVHVWFYTPDGKIIFQHRGKDVDTFPDLLDATVGGHVDIGMDFVDTAIKEVLEETGLEITPNDLWLVEKIQRKSFDSKTGKTNNVIRAVYGYCYTGAINVLRVESGKGQGFEAWSEKDLENLSSEDKKKFIKAMTEGEMLAVFRKMVLKSGDGER